MTLNSEFCSFLSAPHWVFQSFTYFPSGTLTVFSLELSTSLPNTIFLFYRTAELKKENGNQLFKIKQYKSALILYSESINLCPDTASYYGNRAACYMMMGNYRLALEDALKSVSLDNGFLKGYQRMLKCGIALGDVTVAEQAVKRVEELEPSKASIANELRSLGALRQFEAEAQKAEEKKDPRKVVYCMDRYVTMYFIFSYSFYFGRISPPTVEWSCLK